MEHRLLSTTRTQTSIDVKTFFNVFFILVTFLRLFNFLKIIFLHFYFL